MFVASSLKVRLSLASATLILASVGLTVYFVLREASRGTEQIVLESQADDAQRLATAVSQRLVELQRALRVVAALVPAEAIGEPQQLAEFLRGQPVLTTLFSSVSIASVNGRIVAISDVQGIRNPDTDISDRAYFKTTLSAARPVISQVTPSRVSGEPIVVFTMPVIGREGRVLAVMAAALRLSSRSLFDGLAQVSSDRGSPISTIVTDSTGTIIFHPAKGWVLRNAVAEPAIAGAFAAWKARGSPIDTEGIALRVGDHEVGVAGIADADWLVFRTARADALLHGISEAERRATWLAFGVAAAGGALTLLITLFLLRPLARLRSRALRLLDDDASVDGGWPAGHGEIGELSEVIQQVIHERQASELASQVLLAKMRAVMAKAPVGIAFTRNRRFELVSAEFSRIFGYPEGDLEGEPVRIIYASDEFYQGLGTRAGAAFATRRVFAEEIEFVRRDGSRFWGQLLGAPVSDDDLPSGTIWTLEDVSDARKKRDALAWAATHDALTRVANRQSFETLVAEQLSERRRHESACALFIDLDGFKPVNDSAGHAAGDQLLKDVASIVKARIRADDLVARLGGDEFGVLLRRCTLESALEVAEGIRARVEAHAMQWNGATFQVHASIGVVHIDAAYKDVAAVIAAADAACYAAKRAGRNAVRSGSFLRLV
jgi:diguanylate cyclase (GGDEF)-like protein/PAS domain S-box-containing protein